MTLKVLYDGHCFFCEQYSQLVTLREKKGDVELISLRDSPEYLELFSKKGLSADNGFGVIDDDAFYYGAEAMAHLNNLASDKNIFFKYLNPLFSRKWLAAPIYQMLVVMRKLLLVLQGLPLVARQTSEDVTFSRSITSRAITLAPLALTIIFTVQFVFMAQERVAATIGIIVGLSLYGAIFTNRLKARILCDKLFLQGWKTLFIFGCMVFLLGNLSSHVSISRSLCFICFWPLVGIALDDAYQRKKNAKAGATASLILAVLLFVVSFPGLYLAPFFNGIAGWTYIVDKTTPIATYTYELENKNGETVLLNHAFLEPSTQIFRFQNAYISSGYSFDDFLSLLMRVYEYRYADIKSNRLPYQKHLGALAYPTHNLTDNNGADYDNSFRPEYISAIRIIQIEVAWTGEQVSREVLHEKYFQ